MLGASLMFTLFHSISLQVKLKYKLLVNEDLFLYELDLWLNRRIINKKNWVLVYNVFHFIIQELINNCKNL